MTTPRIEEIKNRILKELSEHQVRYDCHFPRGDVYKGFALNDDMAPALRYSFFEIEVPLFEMKKAMKELRDDGLVELVMTIDSVEERPSGSGWFLTQKGLAYVVDNNLADKDL